MAVSQLTESEVMLVDITQISQVISSLGFPIVMCLTLMKYCEELNEQHKSETQALRDAINSSTSMVSKLDSKIDTLLDVFKERFSK